MGLKINLNEKTDLRVVEKQLEESTDKEVVITSKSSFSWSIVEKIFKRFYNKFKFVVETTGLYHFHDFLTLRGQNPFKLVILYDCYNNEYLNGERSCYKTLQSILILIGKQRFTVRFIMTELNKKFFSFNKGLMNDLVKNDIEIEYA